MSSSLDDSQAEETQGGCSGWASREGEGPGVLEAGVIGAGKRGLSARWAGACQTAGRAPRVAGGFEPSTRQPKNGKCLQPLHTGERFLEK